jgi:hypothetical protein
MKKGPRDAQTCPISSSREGFLQTAQKSTGAKGKDNCAHIEGKIPIEVHQYAQAAVAFRNRLHGILLTRVVVVGEVILMAECGKSGRQIRQKQGICPAFAFT